jgi:hypothetical protein
MPWAAAALAVAATLTGPVAAQAATGAGPGPSGSLTSNPYSPAYGHPYRHGAVPTLTTAAKMKAYDAGTAAASPNNLTYHGSNDGIGVTTGPQKVYLVFWGSQWGGQGTDGNGYTTLTGDPSGEAPRLQALYRGLGTNGELWSGVMTQYCEGVAAGSQACPSNVPHVTYPSGGALAGVWVDESAAAPAQASSNQLAQEAVNAAGHFGNGDPTANRDAQYVVLSPTGTHPDGFPTSGFCAWHTWTSSAYGDIAFHNMPYVTDAGGNCGQNIVNSGSAGTLDGVTIVDGHEYAETITDQNPAGGWLDSSGAENGDKCAWLAPGQVGGMGNLSLATGTFAMQGTWSNDTAQCAFARPIVSTELPAGSTQCAGEGGTCTFSGSAVVAFGAGAYLYKQATGSIACSSTGFGSDPAYGVLKACYLAPTGGPSGYSACAAEGGTCSFSGSRMVAYGANGAFNYRLLSGSTACTNTALGGDPYYGVAKSCYAAPSATPAGGWAQCAAEGGSCTLGGTEPVEYGGNGSFTSQLASGTVGCSNSSFQGDPLPGIAKSCYVRAGAPPGYSTQCSAENGTCSFSGQRTVAFGAVGEFVYQTFTGAVSCTAAAFGTDPVYGVAKACYLTP